MFKVPEKYRLKNGVMSSDSGYGNNGMFLIPFEGIEFKIVASDGDGWNHVSVSLPNRCPIWKEMCFVKDTFWGEDDCVIQYHPSKEDYIDNHPFCLHLWQKIGIDIPRPPKILIGL